MFFDACVKLCSESSAKIMNGDEGIESIIGGLFFKVNCEFLAVTFYFNAT